VLIVTVASRVTPTAYAELAAWGESEEAEGRGRGTLRDNGPNIMGVEDLESLLKIAKLKAARPLVRC